MGAWDVTALGNDDAADWTAELLDAEKPVEFLEKTFVLAQRDGYLEAPEGSQLVAAAAVVAVAASGTAPKGFPENVSRWLRGKEGSLKGLAAIASAAVMRVRRDNSELRELWQETDHFADWEADIEAIVTALR